jgi:hypothetical protein
MVASQAGLALSANGPDIEGNIMDRAVLLSISLHRLGISKKVKTQKKGDFIAGAIEVPVDVNKALIKGSKKILSSGAYDQIVKGDNAFISALRDLALPSLFRAGVYAVPLGLLDRVDRMVVKYLTVERPLLVQNFLAQYNDCLLDAELQLGSFFDPTNYLDLAAVDSRFWVDYKYVSTSVPEKLKRVRADIFEREEGRAKSEIESMTDEIKTVLRESVRDLLAHAAERLGEKADGSKKIFKDTMIGNIKAFLETFHDRNIAQDGELETICSEISTLLEGITPDRLRVNADLRDQVRASFQGITATLDGMLVDAPKRKMRVMEGGEND